MLWECLSSVKNDKLVRVKRKLGGNKYMATLNENVRGKKLRLIKQFTFQLDKDPVVGKIYFLSQR